MVRELTTEEAANLLDIRRTDQLLELLAGLHVDNGAEWQWLPIGGREANATNVELATEQTPPIIERITNGLDAMLELAHVEAGSEPASPRLAAETWFGIPGGSLGTLENSRALVGRWAPKVRVDVSMPASIRPLLYPSRMRA
jgi:hypothetical protein